MNDIILLKLGEIVLKGLNRKSFEQKLVSNVRRRLAHIGKFRVYCLQSTVYVEAAEDGADMDAAFEALQKVCGIVKLSRAAACEKDKDAIAKLAIDYLRDDMLRAKSFKVESKRSDKSFPMTSVELSQYVGGELNEAYPNVEVDVHDPELVVNIEVRDLAAYVHAAPVPGAGGMPVGCNGVAVTLLSGGIDSPVAGYMIAKRGVKIDAVYFHAPPYTSERAKQKVVDLAKLVARYSGPIRLHVVNFTEIQLAIYEKCPHDELTIIMRRYMMKIAEHFADEDKCLGLITGESIGQVASQTMQSLAATNEVCHMPVYRPLIAMDKNDIIDISNKIDTYETSILPYEDCCTIFVAKHPVTKPNINRIKKSEERLNDVIDELMKTAIDTTEVIMVDAE